MVKRVCVGLLNLLNALRWGIQFLFCKVFFNKNNNNNLLQLNKDMINYIFVPHADDELIGANSIISNYHAKTVVLYFGFTGSNNSLENKDIRWAELKAFCLNKNVEIMKINNEEELKTFLMPRLSSANLFFPSVVDWHGEHRIMSHYVKNLLVNMSDEINIYWYSITVPICSNNTMYFGQNKKELNEKYSFFHLCYKSQAHLPTKRFIKQERINGIFIKQYAAENFLRISLSELNNAVDFCEKNTVLLNKLKKRINSLIGIRRASRKIYRSLFKGEKNETL